MAGPEGERWIAAVSGRRLTVEALAGNDDAAHTTTTTTTTRKTTRTDTVDSRTPDAAVLVVTELDDPTADMVIADLNDRQVPVVRFDPADFGEGLQMSTRLDHTQPPRLALGAPRRSLIRDRVMTSRDLAQTYREWLLTA